MTDYTIRRVRPEDLEELTALVQRTLSHSLADHYDPAFIERHRQMHTIEYLTGQSREGRMHVARDNASGRIIGTATIESFWGEPTTGILLSIYVLPELQGKGIGRAMVKALEHDAEELHFERIAIFAYRNAIPFYERLGYALDDSRPAPEPGLYPMVKITKGNR
mgnify:CR=1 FL=1